MHNGLPLCWNLTPEARALVRNFGESPAVAAAQRQSRDSCKLQHLIFNPGSTRSTRQRKPTRRHAAPNKHPAGNADRAHCARPAVGTQRCHPLSTVDGQLGDCDSLPESHPPAVARLSLDFPDHHTCREQRLHSFHCLPHPLPWRPLSGACVVVARVRQIPAHRGSRAECGLLRHLDRLLCFDTGRAMDVRTPESRGFGGPGSI